MPQYAAIDQPVPLRRCAPPVKTIRAPPPVMRSRAIIYDGSVSRHAALDIDVVTIFSRAVIDADRLPSGAALRRYLADFALMIGCCGATRRSRFIMAAAPRYVPGELGISLSGDAIAAGTWVASPRSILYGIHERLAHFGVRGVGSTFIAKHRSGQGSTLSHRQHARRLYSARPRARSAAMMLRRGCFRKASLASSARHSSRKVICRHRRRRRFLFVAPSRLEEPLDECSMSRYQ